jgi:hypothetical protein
MKQPSPNYISYRDLPPAQPDSPLTVEWDFYRQEVGRLLAEGHAGRHVLIKGAAIIGIYDTHLEASTEGSRRFFGLPHLVHEIQAEERVYRAGGWWRPWQFKRTQ